MGYLFRQIYMIRLSSPTPHHIFYSWYVYNSHSLLFIVSPTLYIYIMWMEFIGAIYGLYMDDKTHWSNSWNALKWPRWRRRCPCATCWRAPCASVSSCCPCSASKQGEIGNEFHGKNHGSTMEKWWFHQQNHRKTMGQLRKTIGKCWFKKDT